MIEPIERVEIVLSPAPWRFAVDNATRITTHWVDTLKRTPALWNGRVLVVEDVALGDGVLSGNAVTADFASFIAWRDWGFPDRSVVNCFASAVILSADGAVVFARMGEDTANGGKVYPPGGSLEPDDADETGRVDVFAAIERELLEETGLRAGDGECLGALAIADGARLSVARLYRFERAAEDIAGEIRSTIAAQDDPELADAVILRRPADVALHDMPLYASALAKAYLTDALPLDIRGSSMDQPALQAR